MDRDRARTAAAAALAVVAVATAAAAVGGPEAPGGSEGAGTGEGGGIGLGSGEGVGLVSPSTISSGGETAFAYVLLAVVLVGGTVLAAWLAAAVYGWSLEEFLAFARRLLRALGYVAGTLLVGAALVALLVAISRAVLGTGGGSGLLAGTGDAESGAGTGTGAFGLPTGVPVAALVVVLAVGVVAVLARGSPSEDAPGGGDERTDAESTTGSVPALDVPGEREADDEAAENEVYRGWLALADAAGVDGRGHTPGEVARRASEAGLDRRAVEELTALFLEVRYGTAAPTAERERRAQAAVERIDGGAGR